MGCLFIVIIYAFCMLVGFYFLHIIGAVLGFLLASWIVAKLNSF